MTTNLYASLLHTLETENLAFKKFIGILEREAQILGDTYTHEQIHQIAQQKTTWHQEYGAIQNKRRQLLQALEVRDSADALQDLAQDDPIFKNHLDSLLALAAQAQSLNEANGKVIHEYLSHHQQALSALRNLHPARSTDTYDSSGKHSKNQPGQHTQAKV